MPPHAQVHCLLIHRYGLWWLGVRTEVRLPHISVHLTRAGALRTCGRVVRKIVES